MSPTPDDEICLFWDQSNIFIPAQSLAAKRELSSICGLAIRIAFQPLMELAMAGRRMIRGVCVGSGSPESPVWHHIRTLGLTVEVYERGAVSGKEQGVDQCLQSHMLRACLDEETPKTAVLLTGDGAGYLDGVGFHADLERLHSKGWGVEVLAWNAACNGRLRTWANNNGAYIPLDDYYESITFIEDVRKEVPLNLDHRPVARPRSFSRTSSSSTAPPDYPV